MPLLILGCSWAKPLNPQEVSSLTIEQGNQQTDHVATQLPVKLKVRVRNRLRIGLQGVVVSWTTISGGGNVSAASTMTDEMGFAEISASLGQLVGSNAYQAKVEGLPPVRFTALAVAGAPAGMTIMAGNEQSGTVGTALADKLRVKVDDRFGNLVPGATVIWQALSGGGSLALSETTTDVNGLTETTATVGTAAGENKFKADVNNVAAVTFKALGVAGAPVTMSKYNGDNQVDVVGEVLDAHLKVRVLDQYGNPVSGIRVSWAATVGGGGVQPSLSTTESGGIAETAAILGSVPGENSYAASSGLLTPQIFKATAQIGPPSILYRETGNNQTGAVGAELATKLKVKVSDQFGNVVSGATVSWSVLTGSGSVLPESSTTDEGGFTETTATLGTTAGENSYAASLEGASPVNFKATGLPDAPSLIAKVSGDLQLGTVGEEVAEPLKVRVLDQYGNNVAAVSVKWEATTGGGSVSPAHTSTDVSGLVSTVATLGTTPGENTYTASSEGLASVIFKMTGQVGAPAKLVVVAGNGQSGLVSSVLAGKLKAKVMDQYDNLVPNVEISWRAVSGGGQVSPGKSSTDENGIAETTASVGRETSHNAYAASSGSLAPAAFTAIATCFQYVTALNTGAKPLVVGAGDFNRDGKLDLVGLSRDESKVNLFLGTASGNFLASRNFNTGDGPRSMVSGDLNRDGKLDLVVLSAGDNRINIHLGDGNGSFQEYTSDGTGAGAASLALGDFNGDGKADLAAASATDNKINIHLGQGDGTFAANQPLDTGAGPVVVLVDDVNGDGFEDLAVLSKTDSKLNIHLGGAGGVFLPRVSYSTANLPVAMAITELNGDGKPDLVIAGRGEGKLAVHLGDGMGGYSAFESVQTGSLAEGITAGDFNDDGLIDLAVTGGSDRLHVHLGNGDGTLRPEVPQCEGNGLSGLVTGDFDGDARPDIALAAASADEIRVYRGVNFGGGNGTFKPYVLYATGERPNSVLTHDLNRDGILDVVTVSFSDDKINVHLGNGDGTFQPRRDQLSGDGPWGAAMADINRDGILDLAVVTYNDGRVNVHLGKGDGTFETNQSYAVGEHAKCLTLGDFNRDGIPDIAATASGDNTYKILLGTTDSTFLEGVSYATGLSPLNVVTHDFNRDGKLDLAITSTTQNKLNIHLGNGDGTFQDKVEYLTGSIAVSQQQSLVLGDFDLDGIQDLAAVSWNDDRINVHISKGDGTFRSKASYYTGPGGMGLTVGDFNHDGKPDLAVASYWEHKLNIHLGKGDGTFENRVSYNSNASPFAVISGDFNRDGKYDLAVITYSHMLSIHIGN